MLIKVAIAGIAGRMGRTLAEMVHAADDLELVGGLERAGSPFLGQSIEAGLSLPSAKAKSLTISRIYRPLRCYWTSQQRNQRLRISRLA